MENENVPNQIQLTTEGDSHKLISGADIFMANEGESTPKATDATPPDANQTPGQEGVSQTREAVAAGASGGGEGNPPPTTPEDPQNEEGDNDSGDQAFGDARGEPSISYYQKIYDEDPEHIHFWRLLRNNVSPHSEYVGKNLIRFLARIPDDERPIMYLANQLFGQPLDNEAADYSLGLNAQGTKDTIFAQLTESWVTQKNERLKAQFKERDNKVREIYQAVSLMHEMNRGISTAKMEDFQRMAQGITPEQQQVLQNVRGASQIMRLFEDEYQRLLMDEQRVTTEKYDELLGKGLKKHGESLDVQAVGIVQSRLEALIKYINSRDDIPKDSPLGELAKLEDWEMRWALHSGKLLYNLSLRAAEQISLGKVPEGDAAWRSPPQEHMVRIMNQVGWIWKRFNKGDTVGGKEYMEKVQAHYKALRERHGYGTTGLKTLAGKKIEDYEVSSMFKVSGIFSSWRNRAIVLDRAPIVVNGEKTTISKRIDALRAKKIAELRSSHSKLSDEEFAKFLKTKEAEIIEATYLTGKNGELRPEFTNALGVLLTFSNEVGGKEVEGGRLVPGEKDSDVLKATKQRIRAEIWKRVSQDNPLAVAYFLNGMEFEKGKEPKDGFGEGRSAEKLKTLAGSLNTKDNATWNSLREKLILAREIRLAEIAKGDKQPRSMEEILSTGGDIKLSEPESILMRNIQGYGKDVSNDLASVRLPFNPFMSDVIFEEADYNGAGSVYYSRRIGDIGGVYNSYEAFTKIIGQAGVISREEAMKALKEAIAALDGPNGWGTSQDEALPFFMALLDFWEAGGQQKNPIIRYAGKDNLFAPLAHALKIPNSIAQKYGGVDAISYDEFAMRGVLDEAYSMGITRKEIKDKDGFVEATDMDDFLRKKKKVKLTWWLLAMFRDFTKIFLVAALYQGFKDVRKPDGK